jgi:hypothetical protein
MGEEPCEKERGHDRTPPFAFRRSTDRSTTKQAELGVFGLSGPACELLCIRVQSVARTQKSEIAVFGVNTSRVNNASSNLAETEALSDDAIGSEELVQRRRVRHLDLACDLRASGQDT